MSDAYSAFVDQFYPQAQQDQGSGNPYDQMLMDYLQRSGIGMDDPMVQQIISMSPGKYQAQNAQKQIENERDYQTGRDKYALDVMQASQGAQNDQQKMAIDQGQFDLQKQEYGQKYGDTGQDAEIVFRSMDPAKIQKAFSGDFQAYGQLAQEVAQLIGDPNSGPTISPRVSNVLAQMANDDRVFTPEALATMQDAQDQQAQQMTDQGEGFSRFASKTPEMGQAVRDVMSQAQDPNTMVDFLSGNGGSTEMAYAALDLAGHSGGNPGKFFAPRPEVKAPPKPFDPGPANSSNPNWVGEPNQVIHSGRPTLGSVADAAISRLAPSVQHPLGMTRFTPGGFVVDQAQRGIMRVTRDERQAIGKMLGVQPAGVVSNARMAPPGTPGASGAPVKKAAAPAKPAPKKKDDKKKPPAETSTPPSRYSGAK